MAIKFNRRPCTKEELEKILKERKKYAECDYKLSQITDEAVWEAYDEVIDWIEQPQEEESIEKNHPIIFLISKIIQGIKEVLYKEEWQPCYGGPANDFPEIQKLDPSLCDWDDVSINFIQTGANTLRVNLIGASIKTKMMLQLVFTFQDNSEKILYGEELIGGGYWTLDTEGKVLKSVEVIMK